MTKKWKKPSKTDSEMRAALNVINELRRKGLDDVEIIKRLKLEKQLMQMSLRTMMNRAEGSHWQRRRLTMRSGPSITAGRCMS
jgi:hypothetical protein